MFFNVEESKIYNLITLSFSIYKLFSVPGISSNIHLPVTYLFSKLASNFTSLFDIINAFILFIASLVIAVVFFVFFLILVEFRFVYVKILSSTPIFLHDKSIFCSNLELSYGKCFDHVTTFLDTFSRTQRDAQNITFEGKQ